MPNSRWALIAIVALLVFSRDSAWAGELRIVDQRGLIRVVRAIKDPVSVRANISGPCDIATCEASLINQDGLAAEVLGVAAGGKIKFVGVSEGTWQIRSNRTLKEFQIVDPPKMK